MNGLNANRGDAASWVMPIILSLIGLALVGSFVGGAWWVIARRQAPPLVESGPDLIAPVHNYTLGFQPGWQPDGPPSKGLDDPFTMKHADTGALALLFARDLKTRLLPDNELIAEGQRRLQTQLRAVQHEAATPVTAFEAPAQRFVFQGYRDDVLVSGACIAMQRHGYAYWFISWCSADRENRVGDLLTSVWAGWQPLNQRPNWTPKVRTVLGASRSYTVSDDFERWTRSKAEPKDFDPSCDLALEAFETGRTTAEYRATVLVLNLPAKASMATAREKLLAREKDVYPETRLEPIPGEPKAGPAECQAFAVVNDATRKRFAMIGLVARPDGAAMILCECRFAAREAWEAEFRRLIGSYRSN